jgi:hypothetical protein
MSFEDNEIPIYPNSINRTVIIDKTEYFLSYYHGRINKYSNEHVLSNIDTQNTNLGKLSLITKIGDKEFGNFYQYKIDESNTSLPSSKPFKVY